jgi:hypothetical protein
MKTLKKITLSQFCEQSSIPAKLIRAVVRQSGGWESFRDIAHDVANHGADAGYSGWTYCSDTCAFTKRNRDDIAQMAQEFAEQCGTGCASELVAGFNCLRGDVTRTDCSRVLYSNRGGDSDTRQTIENALAWFAVEEVARAYVDMVEND